MSETLEIRLIEFFCFKQNVLAGKVFLSDKLGYCEEEVSLALNRLVSQRLVREIKKGETLFYQYKRPDYVLTSRKFLNS